MTHQQWLDLRQLARKCRWAELERAALDLDVPWVMLAHHVRRSQLVLSSLQFVVRVLQLDVPDEEVAHDA